MCFLPPTYTLEIPFLIVREQDLSYYPISKDDLISVKMPKNSAIGPRSASRLRVQKGRRSSKIRQTDLPFKRLQELS